MTKYTWTTDEVFTGRIRLAHYGKTDLENASLRWELKAGTKMLASGETRQMTMPTGAVSEVDLFSASLRSLKMAQKLSITLAVKGTGYRNSYDIWVYPAKIDATVPDRIVVSRVFDRKTQSELADGGTVLLMPKPDRIQQSVRGAFQTSFWCWPMFRKAALENRIEVAAGTLGILCDPKHPVFADFPTEFHSNWQWWHLVKNGRPLILDSTPHEYRPTLQVIDNFARNHKLGLICEAKVGKGRLLVCSIDLPALQKYPEARQLLGSILGYMMSNRFNPKHELDAKLIRSIV